LNIKVLPQHEGTRLDKFLVDNLPEHSRTFIQKLIKDGNVLVGNRCAKPSHELKQGETVSVSVPPPEPAEPTPQKIEPTEFFHDVGQGPPQPLFVTPQRV